MSSLDRARRTCLRLAAAALTLGLAACLSPLYGPTPSGERLQNLFAAIEVGETSVPFGQERLSHYLRSELIFDLDGSGNPSPKRYRLTLAITERVQSPIVDTASGRADSATIIADVTYKLTAIPDGKLVATGSATGSATYDRTPQRFADVRAARAADIRVAKLLAEQIRTRLAAALRTAS